MVFPLLPVFMTPINFTCSGYCWDVTLQRGPCHVSLTFSGCSKEKVDPLTLSSFFLVYWCMCVKSDLICANFKKFIQCSTEMYEEK